MIRGGRGLHTKCYGKRRLTPRGARNFHRAGLMSRNVRTRSARVEEGNPPGATMEVERLKRQIQDLEARLQRAEAAKEEAQRHLNYAILGIVGLIILGSVFGFG